MFIKGKTNLQSHYICEESQTSQDYLKVPQFLPN